MQNLIAQLSDSCSECLKHASNCSAVCGGSSSGGVTNPVLGGLNNLTGEQFFQKFLPSIVGIIFTIGFITFFFVFLLGAIQWISSGGDKAAVDAARGKITNAIIGVVILISAIAIVKLIEQFFGINILVLDIGPLKIQ